jgi:glycosyltransferase involved in cell wall biosynthesis
LVLQLWLSLYTEMKILFLADPGSSHTIKWAKAIASRNNSIYILGLSPYREEDYENTSIQVKSLSLSNDNFDGESKGISKTKYLKLIPKVKEVIAEFEPDLMHAHYASSYGLLGALTKFHPYAISVWGTEIYEFGEKSIIHRNLLKYNFKKADAVLSTSRDMAIRTSKFTKKKVEITPFGIDTQHFTPQSTEHEGLVIGTVKSMERFYGIDLLIKAFAQLKGNDLTLKLVGDGTKTKEYKTLVEELKLEDRVTFTGRIESDQIVQELNSMDIFVAASRAESFGVSILEASSCGIPVVSSNVGGLPEVVENGVTGFTVASEDIDALTLKIQELVDSKELRLNMGSAGREFVQNTYEWEDCVSKMTNIYESLVNNE